MDRNKKTVLTDKIVWRNHEDYLDTIVSELNRARKKEKIAKFSGIVASYLDYLALPEQDPELAADVRWVLPVFYCFLGELHAALNEQEKAFQAYSASFQFLRRDNRTDSFDQLEEYIDFLIKYRRFDVLPDVVRFITPKIFNFEGYERAERLYRKLDAVDALKDAVPEELHRFRFLLGLTVPEELSRAEYIMFLLNNYLYNFAKDTLFGMSEEDFRALPADGEASLLKIMQQFDLFNTDEDDGEEPRSYELEDNPFYERVDRVLTETCSVEALEKYRAFCEAHNMKWRIPHSENDLRQGLRHPAISPLCAVISSPQKQERRRGRNADSRRCLPPCPAGSGQEVGGCSVIDFLCISGISRLIICLGRGIIKL